ncbi:hypothetical protein XENOCAPTIV_014207 [Xenoophorus captivus]|uniref:Fibronectin type-III domain-containing protein n=1 Tax=Xenoophorus captivus TaxID=1517983 RepID=A0ABV0R3N0_9TELE
MTLHGICYFTEVSCGRFYTYSVYAVSPECNSQISQPKFVRTMPCPPTNVTAVHMCASDPVPVSWTHSGNAELFIAVASGSRGHRAECTTNETSCSLLGLQCGEVYTVIVVGADNNCTGLQSKPLSLKTDLQCGTNDLTVSWASSPLPLNYSVKAVTLDGSGPITCNTNNASCVLRGIQCGQTLNISCASSYTVQVRSQDSLCISVPIQTAATTVPCAPENVSTTTLCTTHSALITWVGSPGAVGHNVTLTGQDGHTHLCHTNSTTCHLTDLHCGETYSVTATPYSRTCTGTQSAPYSFRAGKHGYEVNFSLLSFSLHFVSEQKHETLLFFSPGLCAPSNTTVSPACEDSAISWTPVTGAEMYIATATADDGHNHTCSSNYSSSCNLTDLHCGETYAVSVVTVDQGCWSKPSSAVQLRTG